MILNCSGRSFIHVPSFGMDAGFLICAAAAVPPLPPLDDATGCRRDPAGRAQRVAARLAAQGRHAGPPVLLQEGHNGALELCGPRTHTHAEATLSWGAERAT